MNTTGLSSLRTVPGLSMFLTPPVAIEVVASVAAKEASRDVVMKSDISASGVTKEAKGDGHSDSGVDKGSPLILSGSELEEYVLKHL